MKHLVNMCTVKMGMCWRKSSVYDLLQTECKYFEAGHQRLPCSHQRMNLVGPLKCKSEEALKEARLSIALERL